MMTILLRSQTLAFFPNSRLNTPMVPGPQTSWVISTSALTHTLSPAATRVFPDARAKIFSVNVIRSEARTYLMEHRGATRRQGRNECECGFRLFGDSLERFFLS